MTTEVTSNHAATIVLLRPAEKPGFEVLLTLRPKGMAFLGGMYVFPGGKLRKEDCAPSMIERCRGLSAAEARKILGAQLAPSLALGHWVGAVRELYEEAGILFAIREDGKAFRGQLQKQRAALLAKSLSFQTLLKTEGLFCDLSRLLYFSRWETPRQQPIRFDTRFYLAPLPDGQTPLPNPWEVEESLWLTPERALTLFNRGKLPIIFPTFAALRTLADFDTMENVLKEYRVLGSNPSPESRVLSLALNSKR